MPVRTIDPFDAQMPFPLDLRQRAASVSARNLIPTNARWEGMVVWTQAEQKAWRLVGGVANTDWREINETGGGGGAGVTVTRNDSLDPFGTTSSELDSTYPDATGGDIVYNQAGFTLWTKLDSGKWTRSSLDLV